MCVCVSYFLFQAGLDIKKKKPYVKFANDIYSRGNIKRPLHFFFKSTFQCINCAYFSPVLNKKIKLQE